MKNLKPLKELIQKAVSGVGTRNTSVIIPKPFSGIINYKDESFTLEDVLMAIKFNYEEWTAENHDKIIGLLKLWILGKSLDNQTEETIDFIYKLLI